MILTQGPLQLRNENLPVDGFDWHKNSRLKRVLREMGYDEQNYRDIPPELLEKLRDIVSPQVSSAGRVARVRSAQHPYRLRATTEDDWELRDVLGCFYIKVRKVPLA